jgi:hypothetical protein
MRRQGDDLARDDRVERSCAGDVEGQGGDTLVPRKAPVAAELQKPARREAREARERFCR